MHTSNLVSHEPGVRLAEKLQFLVGDPSARVFLANDGAAANECAVKLSRLHGRSLDPSGNRLGLVSTANSFHGRTLGALAVTGNPAKREPFEPLPGPVSFVDYGDVDALRAAVDAASRRSSWSRPRARAASCRHRRATWRRPARSATGPARCWSSTRCSRASAAPASGSPASPPGWFPTSSRWPRGWAAGCRSGPASASARPRDCSRPARTAAPSAATRSAARPALAVLETIEQQDLLAQVRRCGALLAAGLRGLDSPLVDTCAGPGCGTASSWPRPARHRWSWRPGTAACW